MGYGVATDYGYNLTGNFAEAGVPIPTDLAARLAGEDGALLKVTGLRADEAFWEAVRQALADVTVNWSDPLRNYFEGTNIGGDVEMTVTGGEYQTATNLGGQGLRKLTLNLPSGFVSVMSNAFVWAVSLEEFVVNGTVKVNDWTGAFDHCTALTSFTAPQWNDNASLNAYSYGVSYMNSAFQNCTALTAVPQYGAEREAEANTLRPVAMQNMLNASGVTMLGPVIDMRYIDPAGTQAAGAFGTQLQDARLMNLNHGDWWFDGTAPEGGNGHGNLSNLDAESVAYLMAHLWDLSTDKTGKNWRTVENSFRMWTVDSPVALDGDAAVSIPARSRSGAQASYVWTSQGLTGWTVRVSGLQTGDKLCIGNVGSTPGDDAITTDGDYTLTWSGAGYVVIFNDEEAQPTGAVRLEIVNEPYDEGNHLVDAAALHVPEGWRAKLTDAMLNAAAAKGWSVWIGDEELKGTPDAVGVLLKDGTRVGYSAVPASGYTADEVEGVYVDDGTMAVVLALTDICDENPAGYGVYFCDGGQHCDELEGTTGFGAASSDRDGVGNTAKLAASLASNQAWAVHRAKAAFDGRGYLMALGEFCWLKDHYTDILQDLFPKCGGTALKAGSASTGDSKDSYWTSTLNQKTDDGLLYFCWISSFAPYDDGANVQTRMYVRAARPLEEGE